VTESLPPEDPRDALIREQAGQIAALTALVAELREQLDELLDACSTSQIRLQGLTRLVTRRAGTR
jgi:hypothetical protein